MLVYNKRKKEVFIMKLEYSIMRYCQDPYYYLNEDKTKTIPLGILIYEKEKNKKIFLPTKDFSKMEKEDVDLEFVKIYINSINDDIQKIENFTIKDYTKFFVNSFKFDKSIIIEYENFEEKIKDLFINMK
jgi:hypothetical protein